MKWKYQQKYRQHKEKLIALLKVKTTITEMKTSLEGFKGRFEKATR